MLHICVVCMLMSGRPEKFHEVYFWITHKPETVCIKKTESNVTKSWALYGGLLTQTLIEQSCFLRDRVQTERGAWRAHQSSPARMSPCCDRHLSILGLLSRRTRGDKPIETEKCSSLIIIYHLPTPSLIFLPFFFRAWEKCNEFINLKNLFPV